MGEELSSSEAAINSKNIGFQLLKKHGWKEGTGLGIAEQGILEPVETYLKNNKRGIGAEKVKKKTERPPKVAGSESNIDKKEKKKSKTSSKKIRKMQELEKRLQETEFERAFRRDFWPDNV